MRLTILLKHAHEHLYEELFDTGKLYREVYASISSRADWQDRRIYIMSSRIDAAQAHSR